MARQAIVTLTALNGNVFPRTRQLDLNPSQQSIQVGRASKTVSKGLIGAENNAWFDSPVMSRYHAELIFGEDNMSIMIKDVASMHGTTLNGVKIPANTPKQLTKGDHLEFGAHVSRGAEEYPPCRFQIDWNLQFWNRGFSVPDTDSSDVEEIDYSEDEEFRPESSPIESPVANFTAKPVDTIDLTEEASDDDVDIYTGPQGLSEADATQERTAMILNFMGEQSENEDLGVEASISVIAESTDYGDYDEEDIEDVFDYPAQTSVLDLSSDEDSDKENEKDEAKIDNSHNDTANDLQNPIQLDDDLEIEYASDILSDSSSGSGIPSDYDSDDIEDILSEIAVVDETQYFESTLPPNPSFDDATNDPMPNSYDPISSTPGANETTVEPLNFQVSASQPRLFSDNKDIPESNLRTVVTPSYVTTTAGGELQVDSFKESKMVGNLVETKQNAAEETTKTMGAKTFPNLYDQLPLVGPSAPADVIYITENAVSPQMNSKVWDLPRSSIERQPSPSDAAMVKAGPPANLQTGFGIPLPVVQLSTVNQTPIEVHHMQSSNWQQFTSQTFADRPQKQAFFQAREHNRATLNARAVPTGPLGNTTHLDASQYSQGPFSDLPQSLKPSWPQAPGNAQSQSFFETSRQVAAQQLQAAIPPQQSTQVHHPQVSTFEIANTRLRNSAPQTSMFSGYQTSEVERSESYDMTSAHSFNQSKAFSLAQDKPVTSLKASSRKINECTPPSKSLKRKADEISDVLEDELHAWAAESDCNKVIVTATDGSVAVAEGSSKAGEPEVVEMDTTETETPITTTSQQPPAKRMKRFAEKLGYAALGGVAVGASLFSILVATAPDFL